MVSQVRSSAAASVVIDAGECTPLDGPGQPQLGRPEPARISAVSRHFSNVLTQLRPQLWKSPPPQVASSGCERARFRGGLCRRPAGYGHGAFSTPGARKRGRCSILTAADEAHLSAQHPQARQDARISQAHEHARRPRRAQAPPGPWPQAAVRIDSRDAPPSDPCRLAGAAACRVPPSSTPSRQLGRSVGGRYLDAALPRVATTSGEPRVGYAVPPQGGRRRRPKPRQAAAARGGRPCRTTLLRPATDYVLIARPGIGPRGRGAGLRLAVRPGRGAAARGPPEPVA